MYRRFVIHVRQHVFTLKERNIHVKQAKVSTFVQLAKLGLVNRSAGTIQSSTQLSCWRAARLTELCAVRGCELCAQLTELCAKLCADRAVGR